ncbi:DUF4192 domain-containing protein [Micromonosporaceae bacterium Da 78-11]
MTPDANILVSSPADLVAVAPYVIGFHPADSLVVIGVTDGRVLFGARYDLPPPGEEDALRVATVIAAQATQAVVVIGYGPPGGVTTPVLRLANALRVVQVRVIDAIRVTGDRWWSYLCDIPECCPAEGRRCGTADSVIAAEAVFQGQVALPGRQALVAQVAAVQGEARAAMTAAHKQARDRLAGLVADDLRADRFGRWVRRAGRTAVRDAERRYRSGRTLTDDEIAWLGVLLLDTVVNEYALERSGPQEWRLQLWTDVLRRVEPACVPTAACLLSYSAWRSGQGALARVAVDRALGQEPQHRLAVLLDDVLALGISPHAAVAFAKPSPSRTALTRAAQR